MKIRHNHKNAIKSACGKKSVKGGATSRDNVKPLSVGQAKVFIYQGDPCVFVGVPNGMIFQWYQDNYEAKHELNYVKNVIKQVPDWEESLREYGFDQYDKTMQYQKLSAKNPVNSSTRRRAVKAAYGGWGKFYGLNDVEFTVPNDTDDPTIFYNGKYYNYYAIEDTLWDYYKEECAENGVKPNENEFENWVAENSYLVYDLLDEISPKSEPGRGVYRKEANTLRGPVKSSRMSARRRTVKASKNRRRTPIMAGAGAGYTIYWDLESINSVNSFDVTDVSKVDQYGNVTIKADCDVDMTVTIKDARSYMYGLASAIENVPAKMYHVELNLNIYDEYTIVDSAGNEKLLLNPDDYENGVDDTVFLDEVNNALYQINEMNALALLEEEVINWIDDDGYTYGGGWSHSTWDGTILSDTEYYYAYIQITDASVIEYVDKAVQGETYYSTYEVFVDDNATGYVYDTEEEAIAEAKSIIESGEYESDIANTYVERQDWYELYDGDTDFEGSEIVWNAFDEYENY